MNSVFSEVVKELHGHVTTDPQYARFLGSSVVYSFIPRGFQNILTGNVVCPTDRDRRARMTRVYAETLRFQLGVHDLRVGIEGDNILLKYDPKSREEFLGIRGVLESIPEEDGRLPEKGSLFFCYD